LTLTKKNLVSSFKPSQIPNLQEIFILLSRKIKKQKKSLASKNKISIQRTVQIQTDIALNCRLPHFSKDQKQSVKSGAC
jgi:hypothetical protein